MNKKQERRVTEKERRAFSPAIGEFAVAERDRLNKQLISGFYEEQYPSYKQGAPTHELESLATADEVNGLVRTIQKLHEQQPFGHMPLSSFVSGEAAELDVAGETYMHTSSINDLVFVALNDGDHQPDGNRMEEVETIAIGVVPGGDDNTVIAHLTWKEARKFADAILTLVNIAEFG